MGQKQSSFEEYQRLFRGGVERPLERPTTKQSDQLGPLYLPRPKEYFRLALDKALVSDGGGVAADWTPAEAVVAAHQLYLGNSLGEGHEAERKWKAAMDWMKHALCAAPHDLRYKRALLLLLGREQTFWFGRRRELIANALLADLQTVAGTEFSLMLRDYTRKSNLCVRCGLFDAAGRLVEVKALSERASTISGGSAALDTLLVGLTKEREAAAEVVKHYTVDPSSVPVMPSDCTCEHSLTLSSLCAAITGRASRTQLVNQDVVAFFSMSRSQLRSAAALVMLGHCLSYRWNFSMNFFADTIQKKLCDDGKLTWHTLPNQALPDDPAPRCADGGSRCTGHFNGGGCQNESVEFKEAPVKSVDRCEQKMVQEGEYGNNDRYPLADKANYLLDVLRCALIFETVSAMDAFFDNLMSPDISVTNVSFAGEERGLVGRTKACDMFALRQIIVNVIFTPRARNGKDPLLFKDLFQCGRGIPSSRDGHWAGTAAPSFPVEGFTCPECTQRKMDGKPPVSAWCGKSGVPPAIIEKYTSEGGTHIEAARELLESPEIANKEVRVVCEIQVYLRFFYLQRDLTHLWYKILRADGLRELSQDCQLSGLRTTNDKQKLV